MRIQKLQPQSRSLPLRTCLSPSITCCFASCTPERAGPSPHLLPERASQNAHVAPGSEPSASLLLQPEPSSQRETLVSPLSPCLPPPPPRPRVLSQGLVCRMGARGSAARGNRGDGGEAGTQVRTRAGSRAVSQPSERKRGGVPAAGTAPAGRAPAGKPDTPPASPLTGVLLQQPCSAALGPLGCRSAELPILARFDSTGQSTSFSQSPERDEHPKAFPPLWPA